MYGSERGKKFVKLIEDPGADHVIIDLLRVSKLDARSCIKRQ